MEATMSDLLQKLAVAAPPEDAEAAERRRARMIASIEQTIGEESRVKRSRAWRVRAASALAIAAALAIAVGAYALTHRTTPVANAPPVVPTAPIAIPTVVLEVLAVRVSNGAVLHEHDPLETASAALALTFPDGSRVDMTASSHVMIDFLVSEEAMTLDRGEILVTSTHAFRVHASAIEVVAKEAATFDVKIIDGKLHVRVDAGEVMVGTDLVKAPGVWPGTGTVKTHVHRDTSTLADQNALLQTALDARRHNDDATAIASLDKLISKYPHSPLLQDARVERMRALEKSGRHAEAVSEAGRYLADFPTGYARDEAKALVIK
jgi:ferric-dicitrate binding protein FerR (iron transport regulator)